MRAGTKIIFYLALQKNSLNKEGWERGREGLIQTQWFPESAGELVTAQSAASCPAAPPPQAADSVDLGWGLRIYICNKFLAHHYDVSLELTF